MLTDNFFLFFRSLIRHNICVDVFQTFNSMDVLQNFTKAE